MKEAVKKKSQPQSPQDNPLTLQLRQVCQEREVRVKQLGEELERVKLALQQANEELQSAITNKPETVSVGCNTENLSTQDERGITNDFSVNTSTARDSGSPLVGHQSEGPWVGSQGRSSANPHPRGALPHYGTESHSQSTQGPLTGHQGGPMPNRHQSVPGSPARRNVVSRGGSRSTVSRSSSQGSYHLPPTPPNGERTRSRGRRNSASSR